MRLPGPFVVVLVATVPLAVGAASGGPRFTVEPGPGGVTRVDTETGALSHCTPRDGTWQCEPVGPATPADPDRLSEAIAALNARVDALSARVDQVMPPVAAAGAAQEAAPRPFTAEAVARFLEMIRRLKHRGANPVSQDAL
jgi:outer membrane murein-binding lipoprotein Lpp